MSTPRYADQMVRQGIREGHIVPKPLSRYDERTIRLGQRLGLSDDATQRIAELKRWRSNVRVLLTTAPLRRIFLRASLKRQVRLYNRLLKFYDPSYTVGA